MQKRKVIYFVKYPQIGKVKTRLAATIGNHKAFAVYNLLLKQNWLILSHSRIPMKIEYTPSGVLSQMKTMFSSTQEFSEQKGDNIGIKMANAFQKVFDSGTDQAILIGSDLADLDLQDIDTAFEQLNTNNVVLGPSTDGGYYLIGFNQNSFHKDLFFHINWSTDQVFSQTRKRVSDSGLSQYILPVRNDIDTIDDIKLFLNANKCRSEFGNSMNYIVFGDS